MSAALAEAGLITLLENAENVGFVASVNRGLALHGERDVVLLNADTEVYGNWLDRMAKQARSAQDIGTVTALSNNATLCSYPRFLRDNEVPDDVDAADLDALCAG